jgi:hypothetical protein
LQGAAGTLRLPPLGRGVGADTVCALGRRIEQRLLIGNLAAQLLHLALRPRRTVGGRAGQLELRLHFRQRGLQFFCTGNKKK